MANDRQRRGEDPVKAALRNIAALTTAHDQMNPAAAGWRELLAALGPAPEAVEIDMRDSGRGHHEPK